MANRAHGAAWERGLSSGAVLPRLLGLAVPIAVALALGMPPPQAGKVFVDTATFLDPSAGKAPLPLLLYAVAGTGYAACVAQAVLSVVAWSWCGWTMLGAIGACLGAGFALALPIAQWNAAILSESLSLSLAGAALAATVLLADRWTRARVIVWAAAVILFAAVRIGDFVLVPFLAAPLLRARSGGRRTALLIVTAVSIALGLLWSAGTAGEQERARIRMSSIVLNRVLADPAMEAFFVAHGMPEEAGLEAWRNAAPMAIYRRDEFRTATPRLQAWLADRAGSTYAGWLLRGHTHGEVIDRLPARRSDAVVDPLRGYASGSAVRPVSEWLAAPFSAAAPPLPLWIGIVLVPLLAAAGERRLRRCDVLTVTLALGVYVLAFLGYHGDAIEVDRHLLLARVLYRVVPWLALACVVRRWRSPAVET